MYQRLFKMKSQNLVCIAVSLLIAACSATQPKQPAKMKYDGQYNILFHSEGKYMASANFVVDNHQATGQVVNTLNDTFDVTGQVSETGQLALVQVKTNVSVPVQANGHIVEDGTIEGRYNVGDRQGEFTGFRYSDAEIRTPKYDGTYEVGFYRGGMRVASGSFVVHYGFFPIQVTTIQGETFLLEGYVMGDGQLILQTAISDRGRGIAASGSINESMIVSGVYYTTEGQKGTFEGYVTEIGTKE